MNDKASLRAWTETKSKIRARFGKLTDENVESAKDNLDLLKGKLQSAYGYARKQAEREFNNLKATLQAVTEPLVPIPVAVPVAVPVAAPVPPPKLA